MGIAIARRIRMARAQFNIVSFLINLVIGWFLVSFLQAVVLKLLNGGWQDLLAHFRRIAFFQDGTAVLINIIVIVVCGGLGLGAWRFFKR
jgi:hypothetical protein